MGKTREGKGRKKDGRGEVQRTEGARAALSPSSSEEAHSACQRVPRSGPRGFVRPTAVSMARRGGARALVHQEEEG
eukprot:4777254-Pyramimonas_sp.AAC.1